MHVCHCTKQVMVGAQHRHRMSGHRVRGNFFIMGGLQALFGPDHAACLGRVHAAEFSRLLSIWESHITRIKYDPGPLASS